MDKISEEEVEHVAWLAKIKLEKEEIKLFTEQFNTILDYFEMINELATKTIPPTSHVLGLANVFRDDKVTASLSTKEALKNAKRKERGFFKSPKIIKRG